MDFRLNRAKFFEKQALPAFQKTWRKELGLPQDALIGSVLRFGGTSKSILRQSRRLYHMEAAQSGFPPLILLARSSIVPIAHPPSPDPEYIAVLLPHRAPPLKQNILVPKSFVP
jgi:hypothetical protein